MSGGDIRNAVLKAALAAAMAPQHDTLKLIHHHHFDEGIREVIAAKQVMKQSLFDHSALLLGATALTLVERLGGGSEQLGWRYTMALYGLLVVGLLLGTFFLTRERVQPTPAQQGRVREDLKDLFRNKPWLLIAAATVFQLTYIVMRGSATPYYFRYFVGDQQLVLFGSTIDLT